MLYGAFDMVEVETGEVLYSSSFERMYALCTLNL